VAYLRGDELLHDGPTTRKKRWVRAIYSLTYITLLDHYVRETPYGEQHSDAKYFAWPAIALLFTFCWNFLDAVLTLAGLGPAKLIPGIDLLPALVRYGWVFPVFLFLNRRILLDGKCELLHRTHLSELGLNGKCWRVATAAVWAIIVAASLLATFKAIPIEHVGQF
jgi:hypothetical protein